MKYATTVYPKGDPQRYTFYISNKRSTFVMSYLKCYRLQYNFLNIRGNFVETRPITRNLRNPAKLLGNVKKL